LGQYKFTDLMILITHRSLEIKEAEMGYTEEVIKTWRNTTWDNATPEWRLSMLERFANPEISFSDIGREMGYHRTTITYWFKQYANEEMKQSRKQHRLYRSIMPHRREEIKRDLTNMALELICKKYEVDKETVRRWGNTLGYEESYRARKS